jgi:hypothetical protein
LGYAVKNAGGTNDVGEYWVDLARFDEFNIGTYARQNIDGLGTGTQGATESGQTDQADANYWLLIVRSGDGSQFDFYKRLNAADPWRQVPNKTHYSISQLASQPMQVGLMSGPWGSPNINTVQFDHFMLDSSAPRLAAAASGGNIYVAWPALGSLTLQNSPSLTSPNWQAVDAVPQIGLNGLYIVTLPMTNSMEFFRLVP